MRRKTFHERAFILTPTETKALALSRAGKSLREIRDILGHSGRSLGGGLVTVAAEKERAIALDQRAKSHESTSAKEAHGNRLQPFVR